MTGLEVAPHRVAQARAALTDERGKPMSQAEFARVLGIHGVTLNRIENGKANVSLDLLERIAEKTGRSRAWLMGEPEPDDEFAQRSAQLAEAMAQIASGFELMNDLMLRLAEASAPKVAA